MKLKKIIIGLALMTFVALQTPSNATTNDNEIRQIINLYKI